MRKQGLAHYYLELTGQLRKKVHSSDIPCTQVNREEQPRWELLPGSRGSFGAQQSVKNTSQVSKVHKVRQCKQVQSVLPIPLQRKYPPSD